MTSTNFFSLPLIEDCSKRVRAYINGHHDPIIDTKKAKLVWLDSPCYPNYYFSKSEFAEYIKGDPKVDGDKKAYTVNVGPKILSLYTSSKLPSKFKELVTVEFTEMDTWFEEEEEVIVHPKDPYKRVDVLQSSRHVEVKLNGCVLADTRAPRLLFETGLPVRTYIPKTDCKMELWKPSNTQTPCPYKGYAHYYNVVLQPSAEEFKDLLWWYPTTTLESTPIRGLVAFYDEKVDVWVDGEKQERPASA